MKAHTTALIGDGTGKLRAVTRALLDAIAVSGRVVAGDYLDSSGSDSDLFHAGCFRGDTLVDLIHCPSDVRNLSVALSQVQRILWVLCPGDISESLKSAIAASPTFGVASHALVLNSAGLDPELAEDEELTEVMELETCEVFEESQIEAELTVRVEIDGKGESEAESVKPLASWLFDTAPSDSAGGAPTLFVERCYGVKGHRVAFGPVQGGSIANGDKLTLVGHDTEPVELRVAEVQVFGEQAAQAHAAASAALLLHGAPKDQPKTGHALTADPALFSLTDEMTIEARVAPGKSAGENLAGLAGLEIHLGCAQASAHVLELTLDDSDLRAARLVVKTDRQVAHLDRQPVLLGNGTDLLAYGQLAMS